MTELAGIDVSNHQGNFGWAAWKGKIAFAGIKVSESDNYADPYAARNVAGARSIGAAVMAYHFTHASVSATSQTSWFLEHTKAAKVERGDLLALDVEQGGLDGRGDAELWAVAAQQAGEIHAHFGCWPVIYTDLSLARVAPSAVGNCPLWLANPSGIKVSAAGPWKVVSFEQTGQSGVDADKFYGTHEQLDKLAIPLLPSPPPVVKPTLAEVKAAIGTVQTALDVLKRFIA